MNELLVAGAPATGCNPANELLVQSLAKSPSAFLSHIFLAHGPFMHLTIHTVCLRTRLCTRQNREISVHKFNVQLFCTRASFPRLPLTPLYRHPVSSKTGCQLKSV